MSDITQLLERAEKGDAQAVHDLLPLVYDELRKVAAYKMWGEAKGHTLQPTALVHEAWLRLAGDGVPQFENRGHFFGAAAEAMRRILIERARRRNAAKRGETTTIILEHKQGFAIVSVLSAEAVLMVLVQPHANIGQLLYELRRNRQHIAALV